MKQDYNSSDLPASYTSSDIRDLYHKYADKLLGYILPVVNNRVLAEECVVRIFTNISSSKNNLLPNAYGNTWNWLMALANAEINGLNDAAGSCKSVVDNTAYVQSHKYLYRMNDVQRRVFCGIYYHRQTTSKLACELNLNEQELRLRLKEAFMIIRKVKDEN